MVDPMRNAAAASSCDPRGWLAPFEVTIPDPVLDDLRERLLRARLPAAATGAPWSQGADVDYASALLEHWLDVFDWRQVETQLNLHPHMLADLDGVRVHVVYKRATSSPRRALLLLNGWLSTFVELLPLVPLLTDPAAHGIPGEGFDVVIPSPPGYVFSDRPPRPWTVRDTAGLWLRLMERLGYSRFGIHAGDIGAAVATFMALDAPTRVSGLHLCNLELAPTLGPDARPLSRAERAFLAQEEVWMAGEGAYQHLLSTKPQTLAFGLLDSPMALAAWVIEKWRAWSDCGGDLDRHFGRDVLLTTITLLWATGRFDETLRDFFDNRGDVLTLDPHQRVTVPTAVALFGEELVDDGSPPREWAERIYDVVRWRPMPAGGHFAPLEQPGALAADIAEFFDDFRD